MGADEDEIKVLKIQMMDIYSKIKSVNNSEFMKENGFKIFITAFFILSVFFAHVRFNSIEQLIISSSIKCCTAKAIVDKAVF